MKHQALSSLKDKSKIIKVSSAAILLAIYGLKKEEKQTHNKCCKFLKTIPTE